MKKPLNAIDGEAEREIMYHSFPDSIQSLWDYTVLAPSPDVSSRIQWMHSADVPQVRLGVAILY